MDNVFVFSGKNGLPTAIFTSKEFAEEQISKLGLIGTLTELPINKTAYEDAIENGLFKAKKPHEKEPWFISNFSSRLFHDHYNMDENGNEEK